MSLKGAVEQRPPLSVSNGCDHRPQDFSRLATLFSLSYQLFCVFGEARIRVVRQVRIALLIPCMSARKNALTLRGEITDERGQMEKTEVRIVAGSLKGRKLACFVHEGLRPTPQLVREALFSILGNAVPDRVFYDVFAGTGVVGLEAVSRGASSGRLIERDPKQAAELHKAIDKFGVADRVQVLRADAYRWADRWVPTPDQPVNVFLSPPFPDLSGAKLTEFLTLANTLWAKMPFESVLVLQVEDRFPIGEVPEPESWDVRKYGRNLLMFRVKEPPVTTVPVEEVAS